MIFGQLIFWGEVNYFGKTLTAFREDDRSAKKIISEIKRSCKNYFVVSFVMRAFLYSEARDFLLTPWSMKSQGNISSSSLCR